MTVLIDTTAFLALLDRHHPEHSFLRNVLSYTFDEPVAPFATNYIVLETFDVLRRRFGADAMKLFAREILPAFDIVWVQPQDHAVALEILLASGSEPPSLVDCTSFVVARRLGVTRSLAVDDRFKQEGL